MKNLAHLGFNSQNTFGRSLLPGFDRDKELSFMDPFLLDLIKIQYSKSLRRLKDKTQVISGLGNVNIRDRMIHSFEVMSASVQSGARLGLNIPLLQASSLGHDLGHVPFGHLGERFIGEKLGEKFRHEKFAIFVLEMVERDGVGLNLSYETLQAIANHSRGGGKMITKKGDVLEDDVVMFCDKMSYLFSDYNDICRIGYNGFVLPDEMLKLGSNQTERLTRCLQAFWKESIKKQNISFDESQEAKWFQKVRDFMYEEVYYKMDRLEDRASMKDILNKVYSYFIGYLGDSRQAALAIALSSEADIYAISALLGQYGVVLVDKQIEDKKTFSIAELLPRIAGWAELDFCDPSRFMDKQNFGKVSKLECFAR
jgi:dGTPase